MADEYNVKATFEVEISRAVKQINQWITAISQVEGADENAAKSLDSVESSMNKTAQRFSKLASDSKAATKAMNEQAAAIRAASTEYEKFFAAQKAGLAKVPNPTTSASAAKGFDVSGYSLTKQRIKEETAAQAAFEKYASQSSARLAKNEAADIASVTKVARREYDAQIAERAKVSAAQRSYSQTAAKAGLEYGQVVDENTTSLIAQRYALYDVARMYGVVGTALGAVLVGTEKLSIDYEKSFANVIRTNQLADDSVQTFKDGLIDLSTQIPQTFQDISSIATLAGQLGIGEGVDNVVQQTQIVTDFTKTVAMFSATTDVAVNTAAESLGRIAQLMHVPATEYENLGSSILKTGMNAVATESDILAVGTEISTVGNLAGFTTDQVIGLSSALASLNVKPERARGSLQRIFGDLTAAADNGGEALKSFAQVAQMSAGEFANAWKSDPQKAFTAFVDGLHDISAQGGDTNGVLKKLGITSVRDIQLLQVLANNTGVYASALADANSGYYDGSQLAKSYSKITETMSARLSELGNTIKGIIDTGNSANQGFLSNVLDTIQLLAEGLLKLSRTGFGKVLFSLATGITAVASAMLLTKAAAATLGATSRAVQTAMGALNGTTAKTTTTLKGTIGAMLGLSEAEIAAATSAGILKVALRTALSSTLIGAGIAALGFVVEKLVSHFTSATQAVNDFYGSSDSLVAALRADTEEADKTGDKLGSFTVELDKNGNVLRTWSGDAGDMASSSGDIASGMDEAADATTRFTVALGDHAKAAIIDAITSNQNLITTLRENKKELDNLGFDQGTFIKKLATGDDATGYLNQFRQKIQDALNLNGVASAVSGDSPILQLIPVFNQLQDAADATGTTIADSATKMSLTQSAADALGLSQDELATLMGDTGSAADGEGESMDSLADKINAVLGVIKQSIPGFSDYDQAVQALGKSLAENGSTFNAYSAAGVSNLNALAGVVQNAASDAGDDAGVLTKNLLDMYSTISQYGGDTGGALDYLQSALDGVTKNAWGITIDASQGKGELKSLITLAIQALEAKAVAEGKTSYNPLSGSVYNTDAQPIVTRSTAYDAQIAQLKEFRKQAGKTTEAQKNLNAGTLQYVPAASKSTDATKNDTAAKKDNADATKDQSRTLQDLVDDIKSTTDRAFDIRFGTRDAKDDVLDAWDDLKKTLAGDPAEVSIKAFDKRGSNDTILDTFHKLSDAADQAKQDVIDTANAVQQSLAKIAGLKADRGVLEYQRNIALMFGDMTRVAEIDADLQQNSADLSDANTELAKSQDDAATAASKMNKTLKGNSQQAIDNRKDVRGLADGYNDYLQALKDSGASDKKIARATKDKRAEFLKQGESLGYSADELEKYADNIGTSDTKTKKQTATLRGNSAAARANRDAMEGVTSSQRDYILALIASGASQKTVNRAIADSKAKMVEVGKQYGLTKKDLDTYLDSLDDLRTITQKIPKKLTFTTNLDNPAKAALKEFYHEWNNKKIKMKADVSTPKSSSGGTWVPSGIKTTGKTAKGGTLAPSNISSRGPLTTPSVETSKLQYHDIYNKDPKNTAPFTVYPGKAEGGLVPGKAKSSLDNVMGVLNGGIMPIRSGEYVQSQRAVDYYGLPFMNALNNMQVPRTVPSSTSGSGGGGGNNIGLVELVHNQVKAIVDSNYNPVYLDGKKITANTNQNNKVSVLRGRG